MGLHQRRLPMPDFVLPTPRLRLVLETTESILARIAAMSPADRAEVSPHWIAQLRSTPPGPWTHGFAMVERASDVVVGSCAYKGPPDAEGAVEIAYGVHPDHQGRGFAKEAARALVDHALAEGARIVRAHTLPERSASTSVLASCGFDNVGEVVDPEDGLVWRWEIAALGSSRVPGR